MAWQDWRNEDRAKLWKGALEVVRKECNEFDQRFQLPNLHVAGPRWDSPDLEMHWQAGGIDRNIHIQLAGESWPLRVSFSGAAWVDSPGGERRVNWWKGPGPQAVADAVQLQSAIATMLPNARLEVEALTPAGMARGAGNSID